MLSYLPPSSLYDPALDAELGASNRGLGYLTADTATGDQRTQDDYLIALGQLQQQLSRGNQDIGTQRQASATGQARTEQDYAQQVALLGDASRRLANRQRQQQEAMGVTRGGAVLQAAAKRAANLARDQAPLDLAATRAREDYATRGTALDVAGQRLQENGDYQTGELGLTTGRSLEDTGTKLSRAQTENQAYGQDVLAAKIAQASANGWMPATPVAAGAAKLTALPSVQLRPPKKRPGWAVNAW